MGIVAIGSSLGGTTIPIAVKQLIPQVGCVRPLDFETVRNLNLCAFQIPVDDEDNRVFTSRSHRCV